MTQQVIADVLLKSFHKWGAKDEKYKKLYKRVPKETYKILEFAFKGMDNAKPATFDRWLFLNQRLYEKTYKSDNVRLIREMGYHFLSAVATGKLDAAGSKKTGSLVKNG